MSDYTPTTEEVKANYALVGDDEVVNSINEQKFDRWLEQHDAEVAKATEERIIKLLETEIVLANEEMLTLHYDDDLSRSFIKGDIALIENLIALIKGENATDFTGSTLPISQEGESDGMADTDLTKPIRLTAMEWERLNEALEGENK